MILGQVIICFFIFGEEDFALDYQIYKFLFLIKNFNDSNNNKSYYIVIFLNITEFC